jgi:A/G-specific adenine glycosylase
MSSIVSFPAKIALEDLKNARVDWFRRQLSIWAESNLRDFPWRRTQEPYAIFIAESLLQKTEAATVAPIYEEFLLRYPTLESLAAADLDDIAQLLQPLGLLFRADRIHRSSHLILQEYKGKIPNDETELLKLPGIGKYAACAILFSSLRRPRYQRRPHPRTFFWYRRRKSQIALQNSLESRSNSRPKTQNR